MGLKARKHHRSSTHVSRTEITSVERVPDEETHLNCTQVKFIVKYFTRGS